MNFSSKIEVFTPNLMFDISPLGLLSNVLGTSGVNPKNSSTF